MRRRDFIAGLGASAACPFAVRAQQGERVRKIGALLAFAENDPLQQSWITVLHDGLGKLGWQIGRNLRIDYRWTAGNIDRMRVSSQCDSSHRRSCSILGSCNQSMGKRGRSMLGPAGLDC
jgi:hypothetical protein